jgi:hypothetical protein
MKTWIRNRRPVHPGFLRLVMLMIVIPCIPAGCAFNSTDHCWVPDDQYHNARDLYIQTGSLEIVKRRMEEMQWRICRRNEVVYRLKKEFEVLPEELPANALEAEGLPPAELPVE